MQKDTSGQAMHDDDADRRREAARALGSAKTPEKAESSRANGKRYEGVERTPEQKERIRKARWGDRPRPEPKPKRPPGRPRTVDEVTAPAGKDGAE